MVCVPVKITFASFHHRLMASIIAIRVRPALRPSDPGYELIPQRFQKSALQVTSSTSLAVDSPPQGKKIFVFDRVFPEDITQEGIWDYLQESVQGFTQGYNVSILAYGQSGAGKSYTMGTACPADNFDQTNVGRLILPSNLRCGLRPWLEK